MAQTTTTSQVNDLSFMAAYRELYAAITSNNDSDCHIEAHNLLTDLQLAYDTLNTAITDYKLAHPNYNDIELIEHVEDLSHNLRRFKHEAYYMVTHLNRLSNICVD